MQIKSNYTREVILSDEEIEAIEGFSTILMILLNIMRASGEDLKVEAWEEWTIYSLEALEKLYDEIKKFFSIALIKKGEEIRDNIC